LQNLFTFVPSFYPEKIMHKIKTISFFLLIVPLLFACKKNFNVNAPWQDITVVYGLLNQNDSVHDLKITKAFLGEGNAMEFAKIPDSSNYPDKLDVKMEEYKGTALQKTYVFDTVTIHDKQAGDSIFYYPDQLMYRTTAKLNEDYTYKIVLTNKKSGKQVTSQTGLISSFSIDKPGPIGTANFMPGKTSEIVWYSAKYGKRYQLTIRFNYRELTQHDTTSHSIDWLVFNNQQSRDLTGGEKMTFNLPGDGFYVYLGTHIEPAPAGMTRNALTVEYIFSVASEDLSTYLDVTAPSFTIVQERPSFTNITNGIGIFSSRYDNTKYNPRVLPLSKDTKDQLKVNSYTSDLGF
jgi:hypothetical protein